MNISTRFLLACHILALGGMQATAHAQTPFPLMPSVSADPDGTLHFNQRTLPLPAMTSAEAKAKYVEIINRSLALKPASKEEITRNFMQDAGGGLAAIRDSVLKVYPSVEMQETQMGGVKVAIYTPKDMPARNRHRVVMMFNSDPTGVTLAAISKMTVIGVQYVPTVPKGERRYRRGLSRAPEISQVIADRHGRSFRRLSIRRQYSDVVARTEVAIPCRPGFADLRRGLIPGRFAKHTERPGRAALRLHDGRSDALRKIGAPCGCAGPAAARGLGYACHPKRISPVLFVEWNSRYVSERNRASAPQTQTRRR
jgi:hypothetical protein